MHEALPLVVLVTGLIAALVDIGIHKNWFYRLHKNIRFTVGGLSFWALDNRVIIEEDEFKTGYECPTCEGSGTQVCKMCAGTGLSRVVKEAKCVGCGGEAKRTCPDCHGKGGLLVAPETAQRRPTTGTVVSAGHKCHTLRVGDKVMYSNFAGYVIDLARASGKPLVMRVLHENEILVGMSGEITMSNLKGKTDIAVFNG